jgi:hypothetical protein
MSNKLASGVFKGRPFSSAAYLWKNTIANNIQVTPCDDHGRCMCLSLKDEDNKLIELIMSILHVLNL